MNRFITLLIFYSVIMYFVEIEISNIDHSQGFFLWSERVVAIIFTAEYLLRWYRSPDRRNYPFTWHAIVDIVAVLPFWVGFFLDVRYLKWVRTLRLLRLLKLNRYNGALSHLTSAFYKTRHEMTVVGFVCLIIVAFGSVAIYEAEREAQPEKFAHLSDSLWYTVVTLTTVGYGDICPVTKLGRWMAVAVMVSGIGIFGTFVSLLGAGFVEEFRNERKRLEMRSKPDDDLGS